MFITFEGPEGSGKSTQIRLLADYLRENGRSVIATREPGGTAIGDQIRACLHDVNNTAMTAAAEILLYSASRAQLVAELVRPALTAGQIVLCDRYADSTMAYQGYGRGLDRNDLRQITQFATGGLLPDLTFLLDSEVERGLRRRLENDQEMNRMDRQTVAFYERVRQGYHELAAAAPGRWVIVDADRPVAEVQADLRRLCAARLGG
jgi:dTMP kinase